MKSLGVLILAACLSTATFAQTGGSGGGSAGGAGGASGGSAGAGAATGSAAGVGAPTGTGSANTGVNAAPATGGALSPTPGSIDNQVQSNQNQGRGTGGRGSAVQTQSSTQPMGTPSVSGSRRDAASRGSNTRCNDILANRDKHSAQEIAACEKVRAENDPALELDRRLQRENSRAVNSICKGC